MKKLITISSALLLVSSAFALAPNGTINVINTSGINLQAFATSTFTGGTAKSNGISTYIPYSQTNTAMKPPAPILGLGKLQSWYVGPIYVGTVPANAFASNDCKQPALQAALSGINKTGHYTITVNMIYKNDDPYINCTVSKA